MAANYTDAQVDYMVTAYQTDANRDTVNALASELNKSVKSIIGKLSREGVYQKAVYKTKSGEVPMTKQQTIVELADLLGIESSKIMGLEKSPKQDIKYLFDTIQGDQNG